MSFRHELGLIRDTTIDYTKLSKHILEEKEVKNVIKQVGRVFYVIELLCKILASYIIWLYLFNPLFLFVLLFLYTPEILTKLIQFVEDSKKSQREFHDKMERKRQEREELKEELRKELIKETAPFVNELSISEDDKPNITPFVNEISEDDKPDK